MVKFVLSVIPIAMVHWYTRTSSCGFGWITVPCCTTLSFASHVTEFIIHLSWMMGETLRKLDHWASLVCDHYKLDKTGQCDPVASSLKCISATVFLLVGLYYKHVKRGSTLNKLKGWTCLSEGADPMEAFCSSSIWASMRRRFLW